MKTRLFYLLCCLFLLPMAGNAAVVVKGQLKGNPHSLITIYRYADYLSNAPVEITQVHTDGAGSFRAEIPDTAGPLLKLLVESKSFSFYILPGGEYAIRDNNGQLQVSDVQGIPINKRLQDMKEELERHCAPLFIDTISKDFRMTVPADSVFHRLQDIEKKYAPDSTQPGYVLLHYSAAIWRLFFLHQLPDAALSLDNFEAAYFSQVPIREKNPFYMTLLKNYMGYRTMMIPLRRYHAAAYDGIDQLIHEAAYFRDSRLKQLAWVAGLDWEYSMKREVVQRENINHRIQAEIMDSITDPAIRGVLLNVMSENNRARVGNKFPLLSLKNEKNETINFADIKSDLILVDFWATWCWSCVEGMKNFPAWIDQCGGKLTIVSISIDDNLEKMTTFLRQREKVSGVVSLYNGRSGGYLDKLRLSGYPTYIILNKNRDIIAMPGYTSAVEGQLKAAL